MKTQTTTQAVQATQAAAVAQRPRTTSRAKTQAPAAPLYIIGENFRPAAGGNLAAFTAAVFDVLGLTKGKASADLRKFWGATATSYHTKKGNIAKDDKGNYTLTAQGKEFFAKRTPDEKIIATYADMMRTGKKDNQLIKNDSALKVA